ncbi:MAG: PAS domain S-box protein [Rhizorhabdus sp.]
MLFAVIVMWAIIEAAFMPPPLQFGVAHGVLLLLLMLSGGTAGAALVWSWRTQPHVQLRIARRELVDAVELAAVMIIDDQNVIRHWSRGCEELYGWLAAQAIGRERDTLLHTQTQESIAVLWSRLKADGRVQGEVIERHRDGHELVIHDHAKLFDHGNGRLSAVIAVTDVTEWRKAEAALRLSEARLATAVSVQGIFIYEIDLLACRTIWMTRGEAFFGHPVADGDLATARESIDPDHYRQISNVIKSARRSGEDRFHFDFTFHYPDGSERLAEGWARIIRDGDGRPVRMLGTHLDVTERRQREQALRHGEAERRAILATAPDAMFVCTERGIVRACSAAACRLFGYDEADLIGSNMFDLLQDRRGRAALRRELMTAVDRGPETPWPLPMNVRRADGELVPTSFVIGDATVEGTRMYVICGRDMRPTIATEERFHRLSNDLAQVSRLGMMGEMAGALAHELSQPLSAIVNFLGAADLMLEGGADADSERLRSAIHRASEQSTRAGEIIRRLRAFILRGEADMRAEKLTSLIREAAALALFNTSSFGVRLSYDFESEDRLVLGDRIQIQQVLVNLIRNAADAMAAHGGERRELLIYTMMARDNLIEIAVRDSGPGIAPEMLERLFSPFATTKREGLGFGLAISRRIIEAHGGQLSAAAAPNGGALFRFTLPVMEEETPR